MFNIIWWIFIVVNGQTLNKPSGHAAFPPPATPPPPGLWTRTHRCEWRRHSVLKKGDVGNTLVSRAIHFHLPDLNYVFSWLESEEHLPTDTYNVKLSVRASCSTYSLPFSTALLLSVCAYKSVCVFVSECYLGITKRRKYITRNGGQLWWFGGQML